MSHLQHAVRKISRRGIRIYYVVIPAGFMRALEWREKPKIILGLRGKRLTIENGAPSRKKGRYDKNSRK